MVNKEFRPDVIWFNSFIITVLCVFAVILVRFEALNIFFAFGLFGVFLLVAVRLRIFQILLSLSHLGRGDHVHGIGDFSRILDTFDPVLDLSQSCHTTSPPDSCIPLLHQ